MDALVAAVTCLLARPIAWAPAIAPPAGRVESEIAASIAADATPSAT